MQPAEARQRIAQWMRSSGADQAALKDSASRLQVDMLAQFLCTTARVMEDEQVNPVQAERVLQGILYANTPQYARWREHEHEQKAMMDLLEAQRMPLVMVVPDRKPAEAGPGGLRYSTVIKGMVAGTPRTVTHLLRTTLLKVTGVDELRGNVLPLNWHVVSPQAISIALADTVHGTRNVAVKIDKA
jgi:hypothetical protein